MTLHAAPSSAPTAADLDAARLLPSRLGVSPTDLMAATPHRVPAPTFANYIPIVEAAVSSGTRRVYGSYWNGIIEHWGTRRLDEPTPSEILQLAEHIKINVVARRNGRGGRGAAEHLIAACAACTGTPRTTATSPPVTTRHARSPNRDGFRRPAARSPTPALPRSTTLRRRPGTIRHSTRCCCAYTPRPRAGAAARSRCSALTSTPTSASSACGRRAKPFAGNRSRRR